MAKLLIVFLGLGRATLAMSEAMTLQERASVGSLARLQVELRRLEVEREASVAALNQSMTMQRAVSMLRQNPKASPQLLKIVQAVTHKARSQNVGKQAFLSVSEEPDETGYGGMDKARSMLNEMLNEVNAKYDSETMRCKNFFDEQCSLMETIRQDIAAANSAAADARGRILAAQSEINYCEIHLPRLRNDLEENERVCNERITDLTQALGVVLDDIGVMTNVLEMTDCDAATGPELLQMRIVKCDCGNQTVVHVQHPKLRDALAKLKSPNLRSDVLATLQELAGAIQSEEPSAVGFEVEANVTNFTNAPVPQTEVPPNPCQGISFDDAAVEGVGKCSLASNPQCYKLQEKFLYIQQAMVDKKEELSLELQTVEDKCRIAKETLEGEIGTMQGKLLDEGTKLAGATAEENAAGEAGRQKSEEHDTSAQSMQETRQTCSTNMRTFESEQCGLKKIRGELYKIKGDGHDAFFQDCEVSDWEMEDCSVSCGGGTQVLRRSVTVQPDGGSACPPLEATQSCSLDACPVDCELADWSGWSSCSAGCGGGIKQRTRAVTRQPNYGGEPCGDTSESESCNVGACDQDCQLADWGPWSDCSKGCGGGTTVRDRGVEVQPVGRGTCPLETDAVRHEEMTCNIDGCAKEDMQGPLPCSTEVDVILLLDGSDAVGSTGWASTLAFADAYLSAFEGGNAQFSIIQFSGPRTFSSSETCLSDPNVDMKATCGIEKLTDFSADIAALRGSLNGLEMLGGTHATSVALEMAATELTLSRATAPAVVVLITAGMPLSMRNSVAAAQKIKDRGGRMMLVTVQEKGLEPGVEGYVGIVNMASRPKQDNLIPIATFDQLAGVSTVDNVVANMCPTPKNPPK